jgi:hypothetical protein
MQKISKAKCNVRICKCHEKSGFGSTGVIGLGRLDLRIARSESEVGDLVSGKQCFVSMKRSI